MRIWGNEKVTELLTGAVRNGREPRSVMITGEPGLGKKTMARYYAAQLLCERGDGVPCGKCRACGLIERNVHPDVITVRPNERGNYTAEDIREGVVADSVVSPNEGRVKVYIIPDMDSSRITSAQIQNILLKLIEEPPDHVAVALTAVGKESFLPTVISRTLCLGMTHVTDRESAEYLRENFPDAPENDIKEAVRAGRGNIGRCREYLEKGAFFNACGQARSIAGAMNERSEYALLKALTAASSSREPFRMSLELLGEIIRDGCLKGLGTDIPMTSCDEAGAGLLSGAYPPSELSRMYELIKEYIRRLDMNGSTALTAADLAGRLAGQ